MLIWYRWDKLYGKPAWGLHVDWFNDQNQKYYLLELQLSVHFIMIADWGAFSCPEQKTLAELKDAAKKYHALQSVHTAFCRWTNTTWEQACERFPLYTSEQRLSQFLSLSFKNIPDSFVSYCQAALQKEHESSSTQSLHVYSYQGVTAYALQHDILSVSYSNIQESGAVFNGAHLFIAHIPKVCTCTFFITYSIQRWSVMHAWI